MKSLGKKGFTLIELLAVITIMGILMLVAIPAVSRTIENSRRDTFADLAKQYISTVRNAVIADELTCGGTAVSATTAGQYYYLITTNVTLDPTAVSNTTDLMESGGKSSWGSNNVIGMIVWNKENSAAGATSGFKTTYYAMLVDEGNHGIPKVVEEKNIKRSQVVANTTSTASYADINTLDKLINKAATNPELSGLSFGTGGATQCTLNT